VKRLALVGPVYPLRGGIALHTAGVAREALRRGIETRVLSYRRLYPSLLFPGRTQQDPGPPPAGLEQGATLAQVDSLDPRSWWRAGEEIRRFSPDVVLLQRWHPFLSLALAAIARPARAAGARVVWMVHNVRPHEARSIPWGPLLGLGIRREDLCLLHAESEREELSRLGTQAVCTVVPMPALHPATQLDASRARRELAIGEAEVVYLFFGHVRRYKGVEVLLEALSRLPLDGPPWRAIIAGEWYVDGGRARTRIARPPLAGRVQIVDRFLPSEEVGRYFTACTVVVLPYLMATQSAVVPEAYAHGRPVVTTRVGGLAEAVSHDESGLLVSPGSPDELAAALEKVRRGHRFSMAAIAKAHAAASFEPLLDAILRASPRDRFEIDAARGDASSGRRPGS
jgi:glycosyltransferase involved in cell wall biosynthesis